MDYFNRIPMAVGFFLLLTALAIEIALTNINRLFAVLPTALMGILVAGTAVPGTSRPKLFKAAVIFLDAVLTFFTVLIPGWWTIDPPNTQDTGRLLHYHHNPHEVLYAWIALAVAAMIVTLALVTLKATETSKLTQHSQSQRT